MATGAGDIRRRRGPRRLGRWQRCGRIAALLCAREPRRHDRLLDLGGAAGRAGDEPALDLLVVGRGVLEPALEFVALVAGQRVADHAGPRTACRCAGSAIGSIISNRRPCCSEGILARAAATSAGSISGQHHARLGAAFGEDAAPGIDHQRMAEGLAAVLVLAALRRREHEGAVLDRARADEHMPMRLAGLSGEGRRNRQERAAGLGERAVERREAQVVADGQAEPAPRQVGGDGDLARPVVARLAIALAVGEIDVEHVDLVVARDDLALAVDQERAVGRLVGRQLDRERADVQEDAELARKLAEGGEARVALFRHDRGEQPLALDLQDVGHLRRLHVVGAAVLGLLDQLHRGVEIGVRRQPRAHLHQAGGEGRPCRAHDAFTRASERVAAAEQRIELAGPLERVEIVAAADMGRADENLRHGHASLRARHHVASPFRIAAHVDLGELDPFARQQPLGGVAIGAIAGGVNLDVACEP